MTWGNVIERISEICGNISYATIIAAAITATGAVIAATIATISRKSRKHTDDDVSSEEEHPPIVIPPAPIEQMATDPFGVKDINKMPFNSPEYSENMAMLYELVKTPGTVAEVHHNEGGEMDGTHK